MKKTTLIKQRHQGDCGVACLAMFLGKTYEQVEGCIQFAIKRNPPIDGMNNVEIARVLRQYALNPMQIYTLLPDVPAILSVPSLGTKKKFHYIYWDGKNMYDPSRSETYSNKDFVDSLPMSDSVICAYSLNLDLPSHFFNEFDWEFINGTKE